MRGGLSRSSSQSGEMIHSQPKQTDASCLNRRSPRETRMIEVRISLLHGRRRSAAEVNQFFYVRS